MTVYFLGCEGRIKIGYSGDPEGRIKDLATGAPSKLVLLATVDGSRRFESGIHRTLRNFRESGEWFRDCAEVRSVMQEVIDGTFKESGDFKYPDLIVALQKIAGPFELRTKVKDAINRAARMTGLPRWRTFDIWYGKARFVSIQEAILIRDALIRRLDINSHDHGFDPLK